MVCHYVFVAFLIPNLKCEPLEQEATSDKAELEIQSV